MSTARKVRVTVTLSPKVVRLLDRAAQGKRSRSQIVEECVLEAQRRARTATLRQAIDQYYSSTDQDAKDAAGFHALAEEAFFEKA